MNDIATLALEPSVRKALTAFEADIEKILEQIVEIQQIPAPTFGEARRAAHIESRFCAVGLVDVFRDELNNVYARLPGMHADQHPALIISAHLDTVFPRETDLAVRREGSLLYGPGIGDNSTGLAGLLLLAESLLRHRLRMAADIWFVANAGEEGLGDLKGMRAVVARFGGAGNYLVLEGGLFGQLTHQAVGVRRFRIDVDAPGGHSWGEFGIPSAIHVLGHLIVAIDNLSIPSEPKTTFNIGLIEGGISVNTIAPSASLWLDLRSEDDRELARLVEQVSAIIRVMNKQYHQRGSGVKLVMKPVGDRPAGSIDRHSLIVKRAEAALCQVGYERPRYIISSTDANIPLSYGYQAVCLGLTRSGNSHRVDEYIEIDFLPAGLSQLLLLTLSMAGFEGANDEF